MHDQGNQFCISVGKPQEIYLAGFNLSEVAVQTTELAGNQSPQRSQERVVKNPTTPHCSNLEGENWVLNLSTEQ